MIDDENSIYVGGLPYCATEDSVRRAFSFYGSIVGVKIINDRGTRGKCYGFVTFKNPRSVVDAINDMDGKTMDGRILRVNGVTSRRGRSNLSQDRFQHDNDREMDTGNRRDRDRKRDREYDHDRDRYRERYSNRTREHDSSREYYEVRERMHEYGHDHDGKRDEFIANEGKVLADNEQEQGMHDVAQERGHVEDREQEPKMDRTIGNPQNFEEIDQDSRRGNGPSYHDQRSREVPADSGDDYDNEVNHRLERLIHTHDDLSKEISQMEESLGDQNILELKKEHKKLEEALSSAKKLTAERRRQFTKLYKCFLQVKLNGEKIKSSEQELQSLVDLAAIETDAGDDLGMESA